MHNVKAAYVFLDDALNEVEEQELKWGVQTHPSGCGTPQYQTLERVHRQICQENADRGLVTWADILLEEVYEALGATTPLNVCQELVQCAAVCCSMVRSIQENGL